MRPDLFTDLFDKEGSYWWNVSKREMVLALVEQATARKDPAPTAFGIDLGCGAGYTTKVFESGWRMVGADVSEDALRLCRSREIGRLCRVDMTNFSLPFKTGSVDLVLALDVVEHVEDDLHALSECYRILKKGGALMITVPAFMALWSPWDKSLGHKRRYTAPELVQGLCRAGFSIRKSGYIFFFVFPAAVLIRSIKKLLQRDAASYSSDFIPLPAWVNALLLRVGKLEQWMTTRLHLRFPFGLSVVAVAIKE